MVTRTDRVRLSYLQFTPPAPLVSQDTNNVSEISSGIRYRALSVESSIKHHPLPHLDWFIHLRPAQRRYTWHRIVAVSGQNTQTTCHSLRDKPQPGTLHFMPRKQKDVDRKTNYPREPKKGRRGEYLTADVDHRGLCAISTRTKGQSVRSSGI